MQFTHTFRDEVGNGFPQDGDNVIETVDGDIRLLTVVSTSPIHTAQWQPNWIYLLCEDSDDDWDDFSEEEQDRLYDRLHHVEPITESADID